MKLITLIMLFLIALHAQNNLKKDFKFVQSNFLKLPKGWNFQEIPSLKIKKDGHIIVFHRGDHQLLEFDKKGDFIREIGNGLFKTPHGLKIDLKGNIWTTDTGTHLVLRFNSEGLVTMVLGMKNRQGKGWFDRDYNYPFFDQPTDVAFDSDGNIYVSDKGNALIAKFNSDGVRVLTWGSKGSEQGQFNFAHGIVIDSKDIIYVADRENRRIQLFNTEGSFLKEWKSIGYPYGLTIAPDNTMWYADARSEKIVNISLDGKELARYGIAGKSDGQFKAVHSIAVTTDGHIFTTEILNWRVQYLQVK